VLHLVQALAGLNGPAPQLWLATRGAQAVTSTATGLAISQSPLWGLGKVIALEHPELSCTRIDLDPAPDADNSQLLFEALWANDGEDQVAFRDQQRYVARLARYKPQQTSISTKKPGETQPLQLHITARGALDNLAWQPVTRRRPGAGEVEIRVRATGLNFKDVLNALGMYPGDAGPLGSECAGEVVALGSGVEGLKVGDAVVAVTPGSFSTFVTTQADFVVYKPANLSFEEAVTIPIPFITAYYTLHRLGKMQAGERVLIHAAAGGVGLAAVQLARRAGAEIFATAGSPEKRAFLKSLGVQHVLDSRTLDFADEIMQITDGQGVNLVLNSLADAFVVKSLSVLAKGGRFLEIGKRGILSEQEMAQLRSDALYFIVDWGDACRQDPALIRSIFLELMSMIESGGLQPLPYRVFPAVETISAFRYMAQAKHIGKVVVSQQPSTTLIRGDGTYLITGGLGGLGLLTAHWLAEQGARYLVLMGRSRPSKAAQEMIQTLEERGVQVVVAQADVSAAEGVAGVLAKINATMPTLRGVIHAAGVLDDGVLLHQDWSRFARVMAPKVEGAWRLHLLTKESPLDFFVLFSSLASLWGSPGQSNHAAANMFLDMLAYERRAQGLPGLSLNWGAWTEVGAAVEHNVFERIGSQGLGAIAPEQGLKLLEQLLGSAPAQVGITPVNWPVFLRHFKSDHLPSFFVDIAPQEKTAATTAEPQAHPQLGILEQLAEAPLNRRRGLLLGYVQEQARKVLGLETVQAVGERIPLNELGLDSLMAVELRNLLGSSLNLKRALPATLVFDYPTVEAMTDYLGREIAVLKAEAGTEDQQHEVQPEPRSEGQGMMDVLTQVEELSDEEVDRLFAQQLQHIENWGFDDE
jgi:myxalamid-type polyketide synthase MxaB